MILLVHSTLHVRPCSSSCTFTAQVCTVFLMRLDDNSSSMTSCAMLDNGELSQAQVDQMGLDCVEVAHTPSPSPTRTPSPSPTPPPTPTPTPTPNPDLAQA